jgi:hypothetical protein
VRVRGGVPVVEHRRQENLPGDLRAAALPAEDGECGRRTPPALTPMTPIRSGSTPNSAVEVLDVADDQQGHAGHRFAHWGHGFGDFGIQDEGPVRFRPSEG